MSYDTYISTSRPLASGASVPTNTPHIPVRIEQMDTKEGLEHAIADGGDASAYDFFWLHTTNGGYIDVQRGDLCTDEQNLDPLTQRLAVYRVAGLPPNYDNSYQKIPGRRYVTSRTDGA